MVRTIPFHRTSTIMMQLVGCCAAGVTSAGVDRDADGCDAGDACQGARVQRARDSGPRGPRLTLMCRKRLSPSAAQLHAALQLVSTCTVLAALHSAQCNSSVLRPLHTTTNSMLQIRGGRRRAAQGLRKVPPLAHCQPRRSLACHKLLPAQLMVGELGLQPVGGLPQFQSFSQHHPRSGVYLQMMHAMPSVESGSPKRLSAD